MMVEAPEKKFPLRIIIVSTAMIAIAAGGVWFHRSFSILEAMLGFSILAGAAGLFFWQRRLKVHYRALYRREAEMRALFQRHSVTLKSIGDAVIATDARGCVEMLNPVAETLTGWKDKEARGKKLDEIFRIVNEETRATVENPVNLVLREGKVVGLANHTLLIARDGTERPIADSGAPILGESGEISGVVLVFRDQSAERIGMRMTMTRLALIEYAAAHSLDDLLIKALDEISEFVSSPIGFYHFVESDQKTLSLQQWSTRTLTEFCRTEGKGMHYPIEQAGVWADCARGEKPVIHNDYASLPHKKGMPEGHATVIREMAVPVMREEKVVAILGVGNKPADYTEKDVAIVSFLADVTWEIVERKRAEETLRKSEAKFRNLYAAMSEGMALHQLLYNSTGEAVDYVLEDVNPAYEAITGLKADQVLGGKATIIYGTADAPYLDIYAKVANTGDPTQFETRFEPMGKTFRIIVFSPAKGQFATVFEDITERKQTEEEIKRSLKEKEVFLSEIHHRVKNNLQIVSSLINLQIHELSDEKTIYFLKETQSRIQAMASIHESLYASESMSKIDMDAHFKKLANVIAQSYGSSSPEIAVAVRAEGISLSLDQAVPTGLVVNELLTNAYKYAFPDHGDTDEIQITLKEAPNDLIQLTVSDNGAGIPESIDWKNAPTLGLKLAVLLTEQQLGGTIELDRSRGTTFTITFARSPVDE